MQGHWISHPRVEAVIALPTLLDQLLSPGHDALSAGIARVLCSLRCCRPPVFWVAVAMHGYPVPSILASCPPRRSWGQEHLCQSSNSSVCPPKPFKAPLLSSEGEPGIWKRSLGSFFHLEGPSSLLPPGMDRKNNYNPKEAKQLGLYGDCCRVHRATRLRMQASQASEGSSWAQPRD